MGCGSCAHLSQSSSKVLVLYLTPIFIFLSCYYPKSGIFTHWMALTTFLWFLPCPCDEWLYLHVCDFFFLGALSTYNIGLNFFRGFWKLASCPSAMQMAPHRNHHDYAGWGNASYAYHLNTIWHMYHATVKHDLSLYWLSSWGWYFLFCFLVFDNVEGNCCTDTNCVSLSMSI